MEEVGRTLGSAQADRYVKTQVPQDISQKNTGPWDLSLGYNMDSVNPRVVEVDRTLRSAQAEM